MMKFIIYAGVFVLTLGVVFGAAIENCHMEKLVECGNPMLAFRKETSTQFPTTEEQLEKLCDQMDISSKCTEDFQNRCMSPMQLQIMGFVSEGTYRVFEEICTAGSQLRTDILKHAECINMVSQTEETKNINTYVEAVLEKVIEVATDQKLPTACCGYQWATQKSTDLGREKCGQEAVDVFGRVTEMSVSTLPSVLCSGFEPEGKMCSEVLPPPGTEAKGTLRNTNFGKAFAEYYLNN